MGVLSALPIVSVGNGCCCLWVVSGGAIAAYLLQQNQAAPIEPGDGALVGLLAGLTGAFVQFLIAIPIDVMLAPFEQAMMQRVLDMGSLPPEIRDVLERYGRNGTTSGVYFVVSRVVGLVFWLFVGAIFSTLGGLLGAMMFRRQVHPGTIDAPPTS